MTNEERAQLKERLLVKRRVIPIKMGDGDSKVWVDASSNGFRHVNPDGPAAADAIAELEAEVERLRGVSGNLAERLRGFAPEWSRDDLSAHEDWSATLGDQQ